MAKAEVMEIAIFPSAMTSAMMRLFVIMSPSGGRPGAGDRPAQHHLVVLDRAVAGQERDDPEEKAVAGGSRRSRRGRPEGHDRDAGISTAWVRMFRKGGARPSSVLHAPLDPAELDHGDRDRRWPSG
jgi:hypothetical protein